MNHTATSKAAKIILPQRLLPITLPTQNGIHRSQLLNVEGILLDNVIGLSAKTRRLEILFVLNNIFRHLLRQNRVVIVQHAKRLMILVVWRGHSQKRGMSNPKANDCRPK